MLKKNYQITPRNYQYDLYQVNLKPVIQQKLMGLPEGLALGVKGKAQVHSQEKKKRKISPVDAERRHLHMVLQTAQCQALQRVGLKPAEFG